MIPKKPLPGKSLADYRPDVAKEWNYEKNVGLTPYDVMPYSGLRVWWKCSEGHEWDAVVGNRVRNLTPCPYCENRRLIRGLNSLSVLNPELAKYWHPTKNGTLSPDDIRANDYKKEVWWKCEKGHEWQSFVGYLNYNHLGCPICSKEKYTSFPEQALFYYIKKFFPEAINNDKSLGTELDVYIPDQKLAIEYDGNVWHEFLEAKERQKNVLCIENNIKLIRVREPGLKHYYDCVCIEREGFTDKSLDNAIKKVFYEIDPNLNPDINVKRDRIEILGNYVIADKKDSLAIKRPDLVQEWHPTKNGKLTPEMVSAGSSWNVWWLGKCGHEWNTSVVNRASGRGCPICSYVIAGEKKRKPNGNDLKTLYPEIAEEWDYERNEGVLPEDVIAGSNVNYWWKCKKCGGGWKTSPAHRTSRKSGCPFCSGQKVLEGYNDLETLYPDLAKEWDYELNAPLTPKDITSGSGKRVWWKCRNGHSWLASSCNRIKGRGCPYCSKRQRTWTTNSRPVRCIETGKEYASAEEAACEYNITGSSIRDCAKGKHKTACGCHWEYL